MTGIGHLAPTKHQYAFRENIIALGRRSFADSQGDQPLQLHVMQYSLKKIMENGTPAEWSVEDEYADTIKNRRLPKGHLVVSENQIRPEFSFWWRMLWNCVRANYLHDSAQLLSIDELRDFAWSVGGTEEHSNFTPAEFALMDEHLQKYRPDSQSRMTANEALVQNLLPRLIQTEYDWQTNVKWPEGRPRSDDSDKHESIWWRFAKAVQHKFEHNAPLTIMDIMYVEIAEHMDYIMTVDRDGDLAKSYLRLLDAYSGNHPDEPATSLYS